MTPTYIIVCMCISSCSFDEKITQCCFLLINLKMEKKNQQKPHSAYNVAVLGCTTGNILVFFFGLTLGIFTSSHASVHILLTTQPHITFECRHNSNLHYFFLFN